MGESTVSCWVNEIIKADHQRPAIGKGPLRNILSLKSAPQNYQMVIPRTHRGRLFTTKWDHFAELPLTNSTTNYRSDNTNRRKRKRWDGNSKDVFFQRFILGSVFFCHFVSALWFINGVISLDDFCLGFWWFGFVGILDYRTVSHRFIIIIGFLY